MGVFFQRKRGKERREKDAHLGSRFWPFEAYRYRQRTHYSKSEEYTLREREREGERGRKRDPTPIASTRAFERVDLVVGAAVSRRERERLDSFYPPLFSIEFFVPFGGGCSRQKGQKREKNRQIWTQAREVGVGVEASGEKGPRTRD